MTLTIQIEFKADNEQQARAMADHVEGMVATLLGDEQEKGNVEVINLETTKAA